MAILTDMLDAVIGGDTHRDSHALQMITPTGAVIAEVQIANDEAGFAQARAWITAHAPGDGRVVVGLEGTRSYGLGLARALSAAGLAVVEVPRPRREDRRGRGKSDPLDAGLAALAILRTPTARLAQPRADGSREALRILLGARREIATAKTSQTNRLRALLLTGDDPDRALARGRLNLARLAAIAARQPGPGEDTHSRVRRQEAARLAQAISQAHAQLRDNRTQLATLTAALAPGLQTKPGIGPVSAAQAIVSYSHRGRCRNEAAFAALAGASPLPASSGRTVRHRLNRGGDRQLNRALHDIVKTRWRTCPRTHAYITKATATGKTDREIRRNLKRYVAREIYRTLNTQPLDNT